MSTFTIRKAKARDMEAILDMGAKFYTTTSYSEIAGVSPISGVNTSTNLATGWQGDSAFGRNRFGGP